MQKSPYEPLIEVLRGDTIESLHYGAVAVVTANGHLVASYGDPHATTFLRSAAKPFQVLPFLEAGGQSYYNLSLQEIAIICASHSGTDQHVAVLESIQSRAGLHESDLRCGIHYPIHKETADALKIHQILPTPNRHNCSGKHTGMLAFASMCNLPLDDYLNLNHPIQQAILGTLAEMCQIPVEQIALGTDGCSAPNFSMPLYHAAWGFARLCTPPDKDLAQRSPTRAQACQTVINAMSAYPDMVGGPDRFDTQLGAAGRGKLICKGGAEGYQAIGLFPGTLGPGSPAIGIAIKIADGDPNGRARAAVALEILRQFGIFAGENPAGLAKFGPSIPIRNWRDIIVGRLLPRFQLNYAPEDELQHDVPVLQ